MKELMNVAKDPTSLKMIMESTIQVFIITRIWNNNSKKNVKIFIQLINYKAVNYLKSCECCYQNIIIIS